MILNKLNLFYENFKITLKDYCLNCSLAGLSYIADSKYHYTERFFWLVCLLLSWGGSYYLVIVTLEDFAQNSISMVVENFLSARVVTNFPSVGICEVGYSKEVYPKLEEIINGMKINEDTEYNYDVEDFMLRVIFHNLYNYGSISSYCQPYVDCDDCIKCPNDGYQQYASMVRANCTELFRKCYWKDVEFDCCTYFQPLNTSNGRCFLLNSIQATEKNSKHWLKMEIGGEFGNGMLQIDTNQPTSLHILNEEDIPHILLNSLTFTQVPAGYESIIGLSLQNTINDPGIREINQKIRKCVFPDEPFDSHYKYYSYSACVSECLKRIQLKTCNCTHYNMIYDDRDTTKVCDHNGLYCLDQNLLISPKTAMMQPWKTNGLYCHCLPSCTEHEIKLVGNTEVVRTTRETRSYYISLQSIPTQRFRRQAVREQLDMVVSIGGILGLFIGASILSLFEFVYFFTVRILGSMYTVQK